MQVNCPSCGHPVPEGFRFCGHCGARLAEGDAEARPEAQLEPPASAPEALPARDERREVVVLFADVSGFTAMAERLDPEELHSIMNRCFTGLGEAIVGEGGYIDKFIGDNVMALFGAPTAHEDDPARACRAALAMQQFLRRFEGELRAEREVAMQMRIGIHQGIVIAGRVGSEQKMDYTVMGDAVNTASRLETAAAPGAILVSEAIQRRVGAQFVFGEAQHLTVKGKSEPVLAYQLREENTRGVKPLIRRGALVGREHELATLAERLSRAECAWIDVRGDLGAGKTRLIEECAAARSDDRFLRVAASGATERRSFGLVRRLVHEALLGDSAGDDGRALNSQGDMAAALSAISPDLTAYVPALWYIAAPSRVAVTAPDPDPQAMRRLVERGISVLVGALASRGGRLVLFLDQYEHADEPSAALLESLASQVGHSFAVIAAARTEALRKPVFPEEVIAVGALDDGSAGLMLDAITEGQAINERMRTALLHRAANVPLFIETLAQEVAAAGDDVEALPSSLRSALVAKLDRLPTPQRDLLSQCSAQGVEFDLDVASHVRRDPPWCGPDVEPLLDDLQRRDVIAAAGTMQRPRRVFRVPVFRDACYQTLLRRDRRLLHGRIAAALVDLAGSREQVSPDLLALHFEQAECWTEAGWAHHAVADRAASLYLNDEALAGYERALGLFELDQTSAPSLAAGAHAGATEVLLRVGRYEEARQHAQAMSAMAESPDERVESHRLLAAVLERTGQTSQAESLLRRSIDEEVDHASADILSRTWLDLAHLLHRGGQLDEAMSSLARCRVLVGESHPLMLIKADLLEGLIEHTRGHLDAAEDLYRRGMERAGVSGALAQEARASNNLGNTARDKGDYAKAAAHYEHALALWSRIGDSECMAGASNNLGNLAMSRGAFPEARKHYSQSLEAAMGIGNVHGIAIAHANLGMLALESGDAAGAVNAARASLEALGQAQNEVLRSLVLVVLGDGQRLCGRLDDAERTFADVFVNYANHPLAVATAHRGLGRIAVARGQCDMARRSFEEAMSSFAQLKRLQEQERTRLDLAALLGQAGDRAGARAQAEEALAALRAMDASHDAARAEALLRSLQN